MEITASRQTLKIRFQFLPVLFLISPNPILHPMPMIAAFGEGLGDGKTEFGVEANGGGIVGFDAERNGLITGGASRLDEGGQDGLAEALSARLGGDADVG